MAERLTASNDRNALMGIVRTQEQKRKLQLDALSSAVKAASIPLPDSLVSQIAQLMPDEFDEVIEAHAGAVLARKRESYQQSLRTFHLSASDALAAIASFERFAQTPGALDRARETKRNELEQSFRKELFAFSNAAHSLVDHARRLQESIHLPSYDEQRRACFGSDGLHDFVFVLRKLIHHVRFSGGDWVVNFKFGEDHGISGTFMVQKQKLERIERQEKFLNTNAAKYLSKRPEKIDLRELISEYHGRADTFNSWVNAQIESCAEPALSDFDRCVLERNRVATRSAWSIILNSMLSMPVPPNPLAYIDSYIPAEKVEALGLLPFGSKEQIDEIIEAIDTYHACDDELRQKVQAWFQKVILANFSMDTPPKINMP